MIADAALGISLCTLVDVINKAPRARVQCARLPANDNKQREMKIRFDRFDIARKNGSRETNYNLVFRISFTIRCYV